MKCKKPISIPGGLAGCGKCLPCRVKLRREWTHRLLLEGTLHEHKTFLTLTYDEEHVPKDGSLKPEHLRDFWKRLRDHLEPRRFRYYAVGEYGEKSGRPHYHAALFGLQNCSDPSRDPCKCITCTLVRNKWGMGRVSLDPLVPETARYVAQYVTKKINRRDDPRLHGREPEFSRQSNRPGIGHGVIEKLAKTITRYSLLTAAGDVPHTLRIGDDEMPIGRYLRKKLRKELNLDERTPHGLSPENATAFALESGLYDLHLRAKETQQNVAQVVASDNVGHNIAVEARQKIFNKRDRL